MLLALAADDGALILEDAQWLDPSTADLLRWIVARLDGTPLHLVATLRSGSRPDWAEAAGAAMVPLGPLAPDEFAALIRTVARDHAAEAVIGAAQIASIAARCDGSPVFAEELTRFALETGDAEALPASLADSLLARLDRLPAGRRLAQVGAVIGTEFPQALLQAVAGLDDAALRRDIAALIDAGILRKGDSDFGPAVAFRHMLLHDAAYMTLLRRDRVALHARTAQVMQREVPHIADALPQVLAHHLSRGGAPAEAARHWERAGTLAARRSAYAEAIGHFRQALTEIETASADTVLDPLELSVRLNLVAGLIATEGFGAPTVRAEMPRVEALGQALDRSDLLVPLRVSKWIFLGATGQFRASLHVARQLNGETGEIAQLLALRALGTSLIFCGRFSEAKPPLEAFVARYDPSRHAAALSRFGVSNHAVMTAVGLAELAVIAQDRAAADRWGALAETYAQDSGTAHDRCNVTLFIGCILPALQGHHESLPVAADRLRALARDPGLRAALVASGLETIRARHTCAHRARELLAVAARLGLDQGASAA